MKNKIHSRKHALIKTLSWRFVATVSTVILAWIVTGSVGVGLVVGGIDALIKTFLFYFHERWWDVYDGNHPNY